VSVRFGRGQSLFEFSGIHTGELRSATEADPIARHGKQQQICESRGQIVERGLDIIGSPIRGRLRGQRFPVLQERM